MMKEDELYQGYLHQVYQHSQTKVDYSATEQALFDRTQVCITYGELLYPSVKKLIQQLAPTPKDIFLDLGSGLGKCALQVFMQTDVSTVLGIEASLALHQQALKAQAMLKKDFPFYWEAQRNLRFQYENFLQADWQAATLIYTCSTCFTQELLVAIGNRINKESQVRKVFSLRPLPTLQLPLKRVFAVECSWDSALCFYYERK